MIPSLSHIAVGGVMGSGKTTIAKGLSRLLRWSYLPESRHALRFLPDLFSNQARWALATQLSFLVDKARQALELQDARHPFVLDRSLHEDIDVFAEHFRRRGHIDERSFGAYQLVSEYFLEKVVNPSILIFCDCPLAKTVDRIHQRTTDSGKPAIAYPDGHIEDIFCLYQSWIAQYEATPVLRVDTEARDFRKVEELRALVDEIEQALETAEPEVEQLPLFGSQAISPPESKPRRRLSRGRTPFPSVYIAAPFTSQATAPSTKGPEGTRLFDDEPYHGLISRGTYRNALTKLSKNLESLGLSTLLPHRDINGWGSKHLNQRDVFESCATGVSESDAFIGIMGSSSGSHYEFGLAAGLGKPIVLIRCAEIADSFVSSGATSSERLLVCECMTIKEIPSVAKRPELARFLLGQLGIE